MLTLNDGRSELWQWDTGRKLTVDADCTQVHFSNKFFGRSVDVDVFDGTAEIPDVLLQVDKELLVWAFVGTAENGYTKISKVFKVNKRNKPADYVFTPTEQTTLDEIMKRLDRIEEGQDPDAIKNAVDEYLANNPIEIDETDPTVPEWAKQPTKPSYTASEVGALSADTVIPTIPDNVSAFRNDAGYLTEHQDLTGYATEKYVQGYAQPKGDYLTEVPDAYATKEFVTNKIAEAELGGEEVDLSGYAQKSELPTKVSQLENDKGYLTEHQDISGKLDASALPTAINTALTQAKVSGEFDGKDGAPGTPGVDGITPHIGSNGNWYIGDTDTGKPSRGASGQPGQNGSPGADGIPGEDGVSATHSWNGTTLTVTSASGTSSANLKGEKGEKGDSIKGDKGDTGADGVSISSVKQTTTSSADGGSNVVTVTLSDGTTYTFTVKNGSKGSTGTTGKNGADGKTPVKGVDYWTDADQEDIVQQVITALGTPVFGRVEDGNKITLSTEHLADGTYYFGYEDKDGNWVKIGTIEQGASYKNLADPSSPDWLTNKRLNSSGAITDTTPSLTTNYIPVQLGDFVRIRFVNIFHQGSGTSSATTHFYDANKNRIASITPVNANVDHIIMDADGLGCSFDMTKASEKFTMVSGHSASEIQFARFVGKLYDGYTKEDVIITVNQEITD